ncbi:hypothetical protein FXO37_33890 [Capsicum annuum]|nr:hypothetical protein FXO37_33890 [Capsicum annuum]
MHSAAPRSLSQAASLPCIDGVRSGNKTVGLPCFYSHRIDQTTVWNTQLCPHEWTRRGYPISLIIGLNLELEKRSKEVAQKAATDDADVRRSTRVRAPPRDNPAVAFLKCEVTVPILHMMFIYRLVSGAGAGAGLGACWVGFSSEWCSSATSVARGSPIRCVDEFLVDVSNSESGYLSNSTNTSLKVADSIPQSPNSAGDSKEFDANIASKDARQVEIPEDAARVVVEQAEKDNKGNSPYNQKDIVVCSTNTDPDLPPTDLCTEIVPYLPAHSSSHYYYGDLHMALLPGIDRTMLDEASNIQIKSLETARDCRNDSDKISTMPVASDESIVAA